MKPYQKYAADGYYVVPGAIPSALVSALVSSFYDEAKTCPDPQKRQSSRTEANILDDHGFLVGALLDPHHTKNPRLQSFKRAILDLACSEHMLRALQQVTLRQKHSLQQIMVFEQSATPAHQDWFYLDSFPPGCLTAAWVALEDIHPNATRFFVIPGSQDFDKEFPEDWINGSSRYVEHMTELVHTEFKDRITIPEMRRGDVLFWNSRVIHGSFRGTDPTKSRLSLTAHYLPDGFSFGNRKNPILIKYPFDLVEGRPVSYLDHWVKLPNTKKVSWFGLRKTTPTR